MLTRLQHLIGTPRLTHLKLQWLKRRGWLGTHVAEVVPHAPRKKEIEAIAEATDTLGPQKLAAAYGEPDGTRTPGVVRSASSCGDLYAWLVERRHPSVIVEFGAAFGVSGMYFCSGLEAVGSGHLYSFEINEAWAGVAERNIRRISNRFTLTRGAFEDNVNVVAGPIDLAFVDAIHKYEFVMRQFEILKARMSRGGLIVLDDIDFAAPDARMYEAWLDITASDAVVGAVEVNRRLGVLELA